MVIHTSSIVFRTVDFSESSKIVTLFTKEHGKIAVMVRGAKKPKSKFAGVMEVGNLLDVVYYYKPSRSVQTLSEASYLQKTLGIRMNFEKMATTISAIELIGQLLHDEEVNKPVFQATKNFILWINQTDRPPQKIFPYLQIRLAELVGHGLQMHFKKEDPSGSQYYLNLEEGLVSSESTASYSYNLTQNQFNYIRLALQAGSSRLLDISFGTGELKLLIEYMDRYFKYHIEGFRDRKSDAIFEQLLQD